MPDPETTRADAREDEAAPLANDRHEAFCQAYAVTPNGARAAREAGYAAESARRQADRLLKRPEVIGRLEALRAETAAAKAEEAAELRSKLAPVYEAALAAGDHDTVLQTVELEARIAGLISGGATIRPRGARQSAESDAGPLSHEDALALLA